MFYWLTSQTPNSILLSLGFITVHWYGLIVAFAIVVSLIVASRIYRKYNFKKDLFWDLSFYLVIFAFIGDRLTHVLFYEWTYYSQHLLDIFKIWQGGLAIHGAIFAGLLTLYIFARQKKISFWKIGDIFTPAIAIGLSVGRWGNYFNQEIYGLPSDAWFSIPIDLAHRVAGVESFEKFIPIFLFASIMNFLIFLMLIFLHHLRLNKKYKIKDGMIMVWFLILYSIGRFNIEFWRLDSQLYFLKLRTGQWLSIALMLLVIIFLVIRSNQGKQNKKALNSDS